MDKTLSISRTPAIGLSSSVAAEHSSTAPTWTGQGTAVSFAGAPAAVLVPNASVMAAVGAHDTDLPGLVPRGAPV